MRQYDTILVFYRNHVKIFKSAGWNENIRVESFISSKDVIRFCIDTCIRSADGDMIAYSCLELCGIDIHSGKIRKTMTYGLDEKVEAEMPLVDISFLKKQNYDLPFIEKVQVRSTNIDYIHHTNNIEYIKFLLNTVSVSELEEHPVTELEIHYATQTFEGVTLGIYAKKNADKALFEIKKEEQSVMKCVMWY